MSPATSRSRKKSVELFVSYSHSDAVWLGRLQPLLQFDHCREKAYAWDDHTMKAGDRWDEQIKAALDRMGYGGKMTAHGFRAMARTLLQEELKFPVHLIEMQLGHRVADMHGRAYNRTEFINDRHEMMQAWADYLDSLRAGNSNVTPFKRTA